MQIDVIVISCGSCVLRCKWTGANLTDKGRILSAHSTPSPRYGEGRDRARDDAIA